MIRGLMSSASLVSATRHSAASSVAVRSFVTSNKGQDTRSDYRTPSLEVAERIPIKFRECDNETIFNLAIHGVHGARKERLLREIMVIDGCDWNQARMKVDEMDMVCCCFLFCFVLFSRIFLCLTPSFLIILGQRSLPFLAQIPLPNRYDWWLHRSCQRYPSCFPQALCFVVQ